MSPKCFANSECWKWESKTDGNGNHHFPRKKHSVYIHIDMYNMHIPWHIIIYGREKSILLAQSCSTSSRIKAACHKKKDRPWVFVGILKNYPKNSYKTLSSHQTKTTKKEGGRWIMSYISLSKWLFLHKQITTPSAFPWHQPQAPCHGHVLGKVVSSTAKDVMSPKPQIEEYCWWKKSG